jgi:hypothetical protein
MDAGNAQLISQLRDIHAAADPGWWPPAPGWWLVALLVLVALLFLGRALARQLGALRRRRQWLRALQRLDEQCDPEARPQEFLAGLNRLFRAVALRAFPANACARLQGEEWVAFIRSSLPDGPGAACLSALARGPYEPLPEFEAAALREQARAWVERYG